MASRVIAQLLIMGGTYVARAFVTAYQQALVNSARQGGAAGANAARTVRGGMTTEEASQILGVRKDAGLKDIAEQYDRLFKANDPAKGGSQYLQAKIYSAKQSMEKEAIARGEKPPPPPPSEEDGKTPPSQ